MKIKLITDYESWVFGVLAFYFQNAEVAGIQILCFTLTVEWNKKAIQSWTDQQNDV